MNEQKDYSLYKRPIKGSRIKGARWIWYYRTYDEYGRRTSGRSTGETNKTRAERFCNNLIRKGQLIPTKKTRFGDYATDWWLEPNETARRPRSYRTDPLYHPSPNPARPSPQTRKCAARGIHWTSLRNEGVGTIRTPCGVHPRGVFRQHKTGPMWS